MSDCKLFTGSLTERGYGQVRYNGTMRRAHRVAWIEKRGPIPDGLQVLHTCDNRACVQNEDAGVYILNGVEHPRQGHLWLGTSQDNTDDMMFKGRGKSPGTSGESHNNSKLTDKDVLEIRRLYGYVGPYVRTGLTQEELAVQFGVTQAAISRIVLGQSWTHLLKETEANTA